MLEWGVQRGTWAIQGGVALKQPHMLKGGGAREWRGMRAQEGRRACVWRGTWGVEGMGVGEGVGGIRGTNAGGTHWEVGMRWKGGTRARGAVGGLGGKAPGAPANGNTAWARAFATMDSASGLASLPDHLPPAYGSS